MLSSKSPKTVRLAVIQLLDKCGMTTKEFAQKDRLTYNQALSFRRGASTRIDLETISRICSELDVKPGELFEAIEDESAH